MMEIQDMGSSTESSPREGLSVITSDATRGHQYLMAQTRDLATSQRDARMIARYAWHEGARRLRRPFWQRLIPWLR